MHPVEIDEILTKGVQVEGVTQKELIGCCLNLIDDPNRNQHLELTFEVLKVYLQVLQDRIPE